MPTVYITLPNTGTGSIDLVQALESYPGINCLTASIANYCYGFATGSYATFFNGNVSGSYGNQIQSGSAQKNNCDAGGTGSFYTTIVPANTYFSTTSFAEANNQAIAYLTSVSQSNANTFGSCSYFNTNTISGSAQKNDCTGSYTGSIETVYVYPGTVSSSISTADANVSASQYLTANSQSLANAQGYCYNTTGSVPIKYFPALIDFNIDPTYSSSYYPLSLYMLVTSSVPQSSSLGTYTYIGPNENDAKWKLMGYYSQSQNDTYQTMSVRWDSNNGKYNWFKVRTNTGEKVWYGLDIDFDPEKLMNWIPSASVKDGSWTDFTIQAGRMIDNDMMTLNGSSYTASLKIVSNAIKWQLKTSQTNGNPAIWAYVLPSTSSTYPSLTDSNWKTYGVVTAPASTDFSYYYRPFSVTPNYNYVDPFEYPYVYVKFISSSINAYPPDPTSSIGYANISGFSVLGSPPSASFTSSISGSRIGQLQFNYIPSGSMTWFANLTISASLTY